LGLLVLIFAYFTLFDPTNILALEIRASLPKSESRSPDHDIRLHTESAVCDISWQCW
jgi:hypothetical protein